MKNYSFLLEGFKETIKKIAFGKGNGSKLMHYTALGAFAGHGIGGFLGVLYGLRIYLKKDDTIRDIDIRINDPETSSFKRKELIDVKNTLLSMSDSEYRNFILKEYYLKGSAIGTTTGTLIGGIASRH